MKREFYLSLASKGLKLPIGTDLVVKEHSDHNQLIHEGIRLGKVVEESAQRYRSPLAFPLMDLTLEKAWMLERLRINDKEVASFHFSECPSDSMLSQLDESVPLNTRMRANCVALQYISQKTDLLPVGMSIGPFSLASKLLADPITPVYLSGSGSTAQDDEEVKILDRVIEMSLRIVMQSVKSQMEAGAKAIFIAEPAANKVFFSPTQLEAGSDVFERYVMKSNRKVKQLMADHDCDLIFHCCGELVDSMVTQFSSLDPAILSLGSSRKLWDDARLVPNNVVLYGNLPSKKFYSDEEITVEAVKLQGEELLTKMKGIKHPFILGTECDVLSVPGCEKTIARKVAALVACGKN